MIIGEKLVDVHLHGPLGDRFGAKHTLAIRTPIDAVSALDANFQGFLPAFNKHGHYAIYADGDWRDGDEAAHMPVSKELHLVPMVEGRAFAAGALITAMIPAITGTAATILGGVLLTGLLFGISFLLSPKVKKTDTDAGKDENYAFSGPENVTTQGAAVPLIYGRVYAGSVVVSAGLELDVEYAAGPATYAAAKMTATTLASSVVPNARAPRAGWPPLMQGPHGLQPKGWDFAARQAMASPKGGTREAAIFIAPNNPEGIVYAWSEFSGFYSFTAGVTLDSEAYQPEGGRA